MKAIPAPLQAILDSGRFYVADLYTITLASGTVLRYTSGPLPVSDGVNTWTKGPLIERGSLSWKVGLEVDTLELEIKPRSADTVGGLTWLEAVRRGLLDGAEVELRRAFMATYGDASPGTVLLFAGHVGDCDGGLSRIEMTVNHFTEVLNTKLPRNLYGPSCIYTLFDAGCGVVKASFTFVYSVGSGATTTQIPVPSTSKADHYFDQGVLTVSGEERTIVVWDNDVAVVAPPLSAAPAQGTTVTMIPGCARTRGVCEDTFDNLDAFKGFPYVPQPEAGV